MKEKEKPSAASVIIAIKMLREAERKNHIKEAKEIRSALKESHN